MPMAQIKVIEGVFTDAQKKDMIAKVTDAIVAEAPPVWRTPREDGVITLCSGA